MTLPPSPKKPIDWRLVGARDGYESDRAMVAGSLGRQAQ